MLSLCSLVFASTSEASLSELPIRNASILECLIIEMHNFRKSLKSYVLLKLLQLTEYFCSTTLLVRILFTSLIEKFNLEKQYDY